MNARRKKSDRKEREKKLDQAIEMTFPASDPIAVGRPTSTEAQQGRSVSAKARSGINAAVGMRFTVGLKLKGKVHHVVVDDVLEAMWIAWEAAGAGRCADVAPFADRRAGRKHELKIYATEFVYQAAPKVAAARELSLSQLFEELLAHEVAKLDPHGAGKFGVYVKR